MPPAHHPTLSLIVVARDEEALIGQCLKSAWFCNELIVVDSFSSDRTVEIARELGARVFQREWAGYVAQKQFALEMATAEWVLLLDADEQATHDLGVEIRRVLASPAPLDGYRIRRVLYHLGHYFTRPIYRDHPVRLFRRARGHIGGRDPHDKVVVGGAIGAAASADPALQLSRRRRPRRDHQSLQLGRGDRAGADRIHAAQDDRESVLALFQFLFHPRRLPRRRPRIVRGDQRGVLCVPEVRQALRASFEDHAPALSLLTPLSFSRVFLVWRAKNPGLR